MSKKYLLRLVFIIAVITMGTMAAGCGGDKKTAAYPTKPIELMVPMSSGGGSDVFARTMVKIITEKKFVSQPMVVTNKPGGSGSVGYSYLAEKKGNPYYLGTTSSSFWTAPLNGTSPVSYKDFTFIAGIATDPMFLVVKADSPYKTIKDFIDAAKARPRELSAAGSSGLSDDAIICYAMMDKTGIELKYVPFNSGGEVLAALLGGHVQLGFLNPGEASTQMEIKALRPLAVSSKKRLEGFMDVPTLEEAGIGVAMAQLRGVIGPKDMPADSVKYLEAAFKQLTESKEWKDDYLKKNMTQSNFLTSAEFAKEVEARNIVYEDILRKMGKLSKPVK